MISNQKQWEFLKRNYESGNLAHAFLFSGQDVASIESFTKEFVRFINCLYDKLHGREVCTIRNSEQICQNCRMIESESFPDLIVVRSSNSESSVKNEKDMMEVSVEQARKAQSFLSYKSYYGNYKVVIIDDAERMNTEAQNCFLKTLEEPKGKTIIFLLTSKPDFLLPTIFSRCQQVKFFHKESYVFSQDEQKVFQDLKGILAADLSEKFNYVKNVNLEGGNFNKILNILQKHFRQLLLAKIGLINTIEQEYTVGRLKKNLRLIEDFIYKSNIANINQKLALEILLMEF